jgi:hypothetical protein
LCTPYSTIYRPPQQINSSSNVSERLFPRPRKTGAQRRALRLKSSRAGLKSEKEAEESHSGKTGFQAASGIAYCVPRFFSNLQKSSPF